MDGSTFRDSSNDAVLSALPNLWGSIQVVRTYIIKNNVPNPVVRDVRSGSGVNWSGVELLRSGRELTTKVKEQPGPQLMHCASIDCRACGCVFQED